MKKLSAAQFEALRLLAEGLGYVSNVTAHGRERWIATGTVGSLAKRGLVEILRPVRVYVGESYETKHPVSITDAGRWAFLGEVERRSAAAEREVRGQSLTPSDD